MKFDTTTALNWGPYVCAFEIMCTLSCTDYTVYGAVCAVSALLMSAVGGGSVHMYTSDANIKVICTFWHYNHQYGVNSLLGKIDSTEIELEQNIYQGIQIFTSSLTGEDMEPCSAYGIVL